QALKSEFRNPGQVKKKQRNTLNTPKETKSSRKVLCILIFREPTGFGVVFSRFQSRFGFQPLEVSFGSQEQGVVCHGWASHQAGLRRTRGDWRVSAGGLRHGGLALLIAEIEAPLGETGRRSIIAGDVRAPDQLAAGGLDASERSFIGKHKEQAIYQGWGGHFS